MDEPARGAAWAMGQRAARRVLREFPHRVDRSGVRLAALARDLRVKVVSEPGLNGLGRWHRFRQGSAEEAQLWSEDDAEADVVHLKTDLDNTGKRSFVLAHEIGHAVLHREMEGRSNELPVEEQERFANAFAAQLLLPDSLAGTLREPFCELPDVPALLRLVRSVRIPPRLLLVRAKRENWLGGLDVLWLDVRTLPNRFTGESRRPRIYDSVQDAERWFLPSNRSIRSTFGDDSWLSRMGRRMEYSGRIEISWRRDSTSKFSNRSVSAEVHAFRMRQPEPSFGPEVLARVALDPEDGHG